MTIPSKHSRTNRQGFTLVEILLVVAVTGLVAALTLGGLGGAKSSQLASGGNQVVDLINQSRQNAISENVPTALVMVTGSGNSKWDYHLFGIYQLSSPGPGQTPTWVQAAKWTFLPTGVVVDKNNNYNMPSPPTNLTANFQGTSITSDKMACEIFLPSGALTTSSTPPYISLVSGMMNGSSPTYLDKTTSGVPVNYYQITTNLYTGLPKVDRP